MLVREVPDRNDITEIVCSSCEGTGTVLVWYPFIGAFVERLYSTPTTDVGGTVLVTGADFTSRGFLDYSAMAPATPEA